MYIKVAVIFGIIVIFMRKSVQISLRTEVSLSATVLHIQFISQSLTLSYAVGGFLAPLWFSSATPRVISRHCWNLVTFSQIIWDIFWWKNFQLLYCFHVAALLFMSARPILGDFFAHFWWFLVKTTRNLKFLPQNCDFFGHFEYFSTFLVQNSVWEATFNFRPILTNFHEY